MLKIDNLHVNYDKTSKVINGLDLSIPFGKTYGILGKNGVGKTTLFESIYRNINYKGNISLDGVDIKKRDVAYVESTPYMYEYIKVSDIEKILDSNEKKLFISLTSEFEIPKNEYFKNLSFGTKKKVMIAFNISLNKKVLLLDEPFSGMDFESLEVSFKYLTKMRSSNKIILVNSHSINNLTQICDSIIFFHKGKIQHTFLPDKYDEIKTKIKSIII